MRFLVMHLAALNTLGPRWKRVSRYILVIGNVALAGLDRRIVWKLFYEESPSGFSCYTRSVTQTVVVSVYVQGF